MLSAFGNTIGIRQQGFRMSVCGSAGPVRERANRAPRAFANTIGIRQQGFRMSVWGSAGPVRERAVRR